jgi:hypothetical protein
VFCSAVSRSQCSYQFNDGVYQPPLGFGSGKAIQMMRAAILSFKRSNDNADNGDIDDNGDNGDNQRQQTWQAGQAPLSIIFGAHEK